MYLPYIADEVHHTGWNACSSCHDDASKSRNRLIMPCLNSDRIYVVDTGTDKYAPRIHKVIPLFVGVSLDVRMFTRFNKWLMLRNTPSTTFHPNVTSS